MEEILSFNQKIICPNCSKVFFFDDTMFNQYFRTGSVVHKDCKGEFNLLDALLIQIKGAFRHFGWHYNLLGCKGKAINFYLSPNELHQLNLSQEIEGGEILFVNFTRSSGNLYPIVMTSNSPFPNKIPNTFTFVPYTTEKEPRKSRISMLYFYASRGQLDDLSTKLMIDAFKSYIIGDARNMSISAQTSIEVLQYRFCEKLLAENMISKDKIRSFLEDKNTFSTQAFTLLPFLSSCLKFPYPDDKILEGVKNLVKIRNDFVHRGKSGKHVTEERLSRVLLTSFILFKYYKVVHNL